MNTNRFETFFDAILAIIITILVLKLPQPASPTFDAVLLLNSRLITYFICFLTIFIIWYDNHILFQVVDEIDNKVLLSYALQIFAISLLPYFATWVALRPDSIPAETMFGIDFILIAILYIVSIYLVYRANPYNCGLCEANFRSIYKYIPIIITLIGFLITYTVFPQGIYVCSLISLVCWLFFARLQKPNAENSERFEALIDAIIAIVITIIVLEIPMVVNGSWEAFFDIKLEFIVYAISFMVCFNFWNYNNNMFSIVNKINPKVIWSLIAAIFVLSLIPYLTTFVGLNFYSFVPNFLYGLDFIILAMLLIVSSHELKESDKANIALQLALGNYNQFYATIIIVLIGMVIGYLFYPPAIIIACLVSIVAIWVISRINLSS